MLLRTSSTCGPVGGVVAALVGVLLAGSAHPADGRPRATERVTEGAVDGATEMSGAETLDGARAGVSLRPGPGVEAGLVDSGASWFWNWNTEPDGMAAPAGVEFVPTVWGSGSVTPERLDAAVRTGDGTLLGFNEPDHADQADMSVEQALDLWPRLEATGLRLGSPAVAEHGAEPGGWLDRFMSGAEERGLRVDFIALHWYGGDFQPRPATRSLRDYVRAVHQRYRLPVWVTEFALIGYEGGVHFPPSWVQARFLRCASAMLDRQPWVERWAWFSLPATGPWAGTGLYDEQGRPTKVGRAFRSRP